MSERRVTIFEFDEGNFREKSLPEMVAWFNQIIDEAPCEPEEIVFYARLFDDPHEGYSTWEVNITRPMTAEERAEDEREQQARREMYRREREQSELRQLEELQRKYGVVRSDTGGAV